MRTLLLALVALALALAGCSGSNNPTPSTTTPTASTPASSTPASSTPASSTPASSTLVSSTPATSTPVSSTPPTSGGLGPESFDVATPNVPDMVAVGQPLNVSLKISGAVSYSSDHIGAHYATTPQPNPDAANMIPCAHLSGSLPGDYTVSCNFTASGLYYLRGHARVTENNVTHDYWGPERAVQAVNATVTLSSFPPTFIAGQAFTFKLTVAGDTGTASVINARYGNTSGATPSAGQYPTPCQPTSGSVPGNFTITCTIAASGTYYLRGFATYGDASSSQATFWSDEQKIVVAGLGIG